MQNKHLFQTVLLKKGKSQIKSLKGKEALQVSNLLSASEPRKANRRQTQDDTHTEDAAKTAAFKASPKSK
jgi:hypothetical protein